MKLITFKDGSLGLFSEKEATEQKEILTEKEATEEDILNFIDGLIVHISNLEESILEYASSEEKAESENPEPELSSKMEKGCGCSCGRFCH